MVKALRLYQMGLCLMVSGMMEGQTGKECANTLMEQNTPDSGLTDNHTGKELKCYLMELNTQVNG